MKKLKASGLLLVASMMVLALVMPVSIAGANPVAAESGGGYSFNDSNVVCGA